MQHKLKILTATIGLVVASSSSYAAPQEPGVTITVEGTKVTAFWNPVIGASEYTLFYAPVDTYNPINSIPMEGKLDLTVDLPVGTSYAVAIKAKDASGESDYSNITSFTVKTPDAADAQASIPNIISSIASNVILASYEDFAIEAQGLAEDLSTFKASPTDANLKKVQFSWRDTRRPWEQSEAYLFGPVDTQKIDPAMDSWPVDRIDLDGVLKSNNKLDVPFVKALADTLHGFHTVEYLVFGPDNNKKAADVTARESEYLVSSAALLHSHINQLAEAWRPAKGNFVEELSTAGHGSKTYKSETAALQEFVNGMVGIADEVGAGKLGDPYKAFDHELVESQFSFNSLLDFENNIRGIENIYLGRYLQNDGPGLDDLVRRNDPELDKKVRLSIDNTIDAIQAIPFPYRDSIKDTQGRVLVSAAIDEVIALRELLEGPLATKIVSFK